MKTMSPLALSNARTRRVLGTGLLAAALLVGGCTTHGKHTGTQLNAAKLRMAQMKSATEWTMAHQAFLAGDLDKAEKHVKFSIELNAEVTKSHVLLGRVYLEKNEFEPAIAALRKAEELDPKNSDARYYQGVLAERIDRNEEALSHYQAAADLDRSNPQYPIAAAEMLILLKRIDEAQAYLESDTNRFEHSAGVRQTLGQIAMLKDDHAKALACFKEARLLAPDNQQILENLIDAQIAVGETAQAEMNLARILTNPDNSARRDLVRRRAECLSKLNRPVEARDQLLKLTKDDQGDADFEAWHKLGEVCYLLKDYNRVRVAATRVIALAPARPEGYILRGLELKGRGDGAGALEQFQRALELQRDSDTLVLLGLTLQEMGEHELARSAFAAAARENPNDANAAKLAASSGAQASAPADR